MQQPLTNQPGQQMFVRERPELPAAHLKPYTLKQLALMYNVPIRTFQRWLRPFNSRIGKRVGHFYNLLQVQIIFQSLGTPQAFDE